EGDAGPGLIVFQEPVPEPELGRRVGSVVRVRGVCGPEFDADGKVTGIVRVIVQSRDEVTVIETADRVSALRVRTAEYLRRFLPGVSPVQLVKMSGVVTGRLAGGGLLVQDETGGFR